MGFWDKVGRREARNSRGRKGRDATKKPDLRVEVLEDRTVPAATPTVLVPGASTVLLGETATFSVTFDNTGNPGDVGYGPYIDLLLDTTGADGGLNPDGFDTSTFAATYLGQQLTGVQFVEITGATFVHPLTGQTLPVPGFGTRFQVGDTLVVIPLPFGSFTESQPPAPISISVGTSNLGDLGVQLPYSVVGGFRYGTADALDNPGIDPPVRGVQADSGVTPELWRLTKTYLGPEDETATGPNYKRDYRLDLDIATGQTITNTQISDILAGSMQYTGAAGVVTTIHGATVASNLTVQPSTATPGGTLTNNFGSVTGSAGLDASLQFQFYVTRDLNADPLTPVVPQGTDATFANNTGNSSGNWTPLDLRDTPANQAVSITLPANAHTLQQHSIATQKTVTVVDRTTLTAVPGGAVVPGQSLLRYDIEFQISDYFAFQNLFLQDILSDGQRLFVSSSGLSTAPTLQVDNAYNRTTNGRTTSAAAAFSGVNTILYEPQFTVRGTNDSDPSQPPTGGPFSTVAPGTIIATNNSIDGETLLQFNISQELIARGFVGGLLVGGNVRNGGSADSPVDANPPVFTATRGRITFYTEVKDEFSDNFPSGDRSVDQGDVLSNSVPKIQGQQLSTQDLTTPIGIGTDNTAAGVSINYGERSKSIVAINGQPSNLGGTINVQPGDLVTYRLTYTLPISSFEDLNLIDFPPLPVFPVPSSLTFDPTLALGTPPPVNTISLGTGDTYFTAINPFGTPVRAATTANIAGYNPAGGGSFSGAPASVDGVTLVVGNRVLVKNQTDARQNGIYVVVGSGIWARTGDFDQTNEAINSKLFKVSEGATQAGTFFFQQNKLFTTFNTDVLQFAPFITTDSAGNSFNLAFGSYDDIPGLRRSATIDLLVTLRVADAPFARDLFLTNQMRVQEGSTNAGDSKLDQIVRFEVVTPNINIYKGVVGYNDTALTLGGIGFNAPGGVTTFTVNGTAASSTNALTDSLQADAIGTQNGPTAGLDAADTVRFGIVVQNAPTGQTSARGDAFDVVFTDTLPTGFNAPASASAFASSVNLTVRRGDGTLLSSNQLVNGYVRVATSAVLTGASYNAGANNGTFTNVAGTIDGVALVTGDRVLVKNQVDGTQNGVYVVSAVNATVPTNPRLTLTRAGDFDQNSELTGGYTVAVYGGMSAGNANHFYSVAGPLTLNATVLSWVDGGVRDYYFTYDPLGRSFSISLADNYTAGNTSDATIDDRSGALSRGQAGSGVTVTKTVPDGTVTVATTTLLSGATYTTTPGNGEITNAPRTIDGVTLNVADRVLVKDQADTRQNGIYVVTAVSGGTATFRRATDFDQNADVSGDFLVAVTGGVSNAGRSFTTGNINLNASGITWQSAIVPIANGSNTIVVQYDLTLARTVDTDTVQASQTLTNTATVTNVAKSEGGTTDEPRADNANVYIKEATVSKTLISTEIVNTVNSNTQAVIGEYITYQLTLTVPEGETRNAQIVDILDPGLAFVDIQNVQRLSNGTPTGSLTVPNLPGTGTTPTNVTVGIAGQTLTFAFGTILNADATDDNTETIVITYRAVVLNRNSSWTDPGSGTINTTGNQANVLVNNLATLTYNNQPAAQTVSAANVTIIEPTLTIDKTVSPATGDAGDAAAYTLLIQHAGTSTDAFDVTFSDLIPTKFVNPTLVSVTDSAGILSASDFELVNVAGNYILRNVSATGFDFTLIAGRTLTLVVNGTLSDTVQPGETVVNNINDSANSFFRWSSLNDDKTSADTATQRSIHNTAATERSGATGVGADGASLNNYADTASATITVNVPVLDKYVVSTSESHTQQQQMVRDFGTAQGGGFDGFSGAASFTGGNNTWDDAGGNVVVGANFVTIGGTSTGRGGAVLNFGTPLDLTGYANLTLNVRALTGNVANLRIRLTDLDGTTFEYNLTAPTAGALTFTPLSVNLLAAPGAAPVTGTTAGLDFARISQLEIRGDNSTNALRVDLDSIEAQGVQVAPGEIVRYRLVARLPEGTSPDVHLLDRLPTGVSYLDDGSARIAFVSTAASLTSTAVGSTPAISGTGLVITGNQDNLSTISLSPASGNGLAIGGSGAFDATVSNNAGSDVDTYNNGTDIYFKLGELLNVDNDLDAEYVIIEFNALVRNETTNQAGARLDNDFQFFLNGSSTPSQRGATSASDSRNRLTVVEPQINNLTKQLIGTPARDAGDALSFVMQFSNTVAKPAVASATVTTATSTAVGGAYTSGVGNPGRFTGAPTTINGVTLSDYDRVLVKNQTDAQQNGVYVVLDASAGLWARASDFNQDAEITQGYRVLVTSGTLSGQVFAQDTASVTLNTSNIVWTQVAANLVVRAATTGTLGTGFSAGVISGVALTSGSLVIDGVTLAVGERVLVKNQSTAAQNGLYTVTTIGATATLTRATDLDSAAEVVRGYQVAVAAGAVNAGRTFAQTATVTTLNTDTITWGLVDQVTAYDVVLTDTLDPNLLFQGLTLTTPETIFTTTTTGTFSFTGGTITITPAGAITLTLTQLAPEADLSGAVKGVTLQVDTILANTVTAGLELPNTARVSHTGLPGTLGTTSNATGSSLQTGTNVAGTSTGERDGSSLPAPTDNTAPTFVGNTAGTLNNYAVGASTSAWVPLPRPTKALVNTALNQGTSQFNAGNTDVSIGEVITYDLTLTFAEGTTQSVVLTDNGQADANAVLEILSATVHIVGANLSFTNAPPLITLSDGQLSDSLNDRVAVTFGDVINLTDNVFDAKDQVVVRVTARVVNRAANTAGDAVSNSATLDFVTAGVNRRTDSNTVTVDVVEPQLSIVKNIVQTSADAGDTVTVTFTVENTGTTAAYDVIVRDLLNTTNFDVTSVSFGASGTNYPADFTPTIDTTTGELLYSGGTVSRGATITFSFTVKVNSGVTPDQVVSNTAQVTQATSLPGTDGGERNTPSTPSSDTFTVPSASFAKSFFGTDIASTPGSDVTIGESVTYALRVTLPEGTTPNLTITDILPPGLQYLSYSIVTLASASNGVLTADFAGTVPAPTVTGGTGNGTDVTFTFGSISVTGDNVAASNSFLVLVKTRVLDVPTNEGLLPGQTVLPNSATFDIIGDTQQPFTSGPVNVVVIEPALQITKTVDDTTVDGGQLLTYTVQISHTGASTGPAFDVNLSDLQAPGLVLVAGSVTVSNPGYGTQTVVSGNGVGDDHLVVNVSELQRGDSLTITYQARVLGPSALGAPLPGNTVPNVADLVYDGLPGPGGRVGTGSDDAAVVLNGHSVTGYVYRDLDNDGNREMGETGIAGVTVTLTGTDHLNNSVTRTTTTDANGQYRFDGLRPGTYVVTESQPAGFFDGRDTLGTPFGGVVNNDLLSGLTIALGSNPTTGVEYNLGELPPARVAGTVYVDADNDGVRDAGEAPLGGVTLSLTGTDDRGQPVTVTTVTASDGTYSFENLRPGSYTVTETQPARYLDGRDAEELVVISGSNITDAIGSFSLIAGQNKVNNNFGELLPASLAGVVYVDVNNNGVRDPGEAGIAGTAVTLTGSDERGVLTPITVTTGADGAYRFDNLRPGTYVVTEQTQAAAPLNAYGDGIDAIGSQGGTTGNDVLSNLGLQAGVNGINNNFGEIPGTISGSVYADRNNDGLRTSGEAGLAGVVVELRDATGTTILATTTTDRNGSYSFTGLAAGSYIVVEPTQPTGYFDGLDALENAPLGGSRATDRIGTPGTPITLVRGGASVNNNFGELLPASLSGVVYVDSNYDGYRQSGEVGIAGVPVTLSGTDDLGNPVNLTLNTNADGTYSFANLRPGTYSITEGAVPAGFVDGADSVGSQGGTLTNDQISNITLGAGVDGTANNFGEVAFGSVAGVVYVDRDNDGVQDPNEPGIAGVSLTLTGTDNSGNSITRTVTTGSDGSYLFANLPISNAAGYTITEIQPAGYGDGSDSAGTVGGTAGNDVLSGIVIGANKAGQKYNFGERLGTVSGYVYADSNNNGLRGSEPGIGGVRVTLTGTDINSQPVTRTTTTAADGSYSFIDLLAGTYTVTESQAAGYLDGQDSQGNVTPIAGSANTDVITPISLPAGGTSPNNNFGELLPGRLAGTVYVDLDNDGVQDGNEAGIPNVIITLTGTDDRGNPVTLTTTTRADGSYNFDNLRPGTYALSETQPVVFVDGKETAGTLAGVVNADQFATVVVTPGANGTGYNFGELPPASLAGTVYVDRNNNGLIETGETGIAGTTITLTGIDDRGNAVNLTTTTTAGGAYRFDNLRPGTYTVTETQPSVYLDGRDTVGTPGGATANDEFSSVSLGIGVNGVNNNFGELPPSSLSGVVYVDANNNGVQDPGEVGIGGANVTLTGTNDRGQPVTVTLTTNADGSYAFTNLRPGSYSINETQPTGFVDGLDVIGTQGGTTGNDALTAIVLGAGVNGTANNFGERRLSSLSGFVYVDADNNGTKDTGEIGIGGVLVTLTGIDDLGGNVTQTTTTAADGSYAFAALRPGTYRIVEGTVPAQYTDGKDTIGTPGGTTANDQFSNIVLPAAFAGVNNNFGELAPNSIAGRVYGDLNNDGVQQSGEQGIGGVTITLSGFDVNGTPVLTTTITAADGSYIFTGLQPGTYTVTETQPANFGDGKDSVGSQGGIVNPDQFAAIELRQGVAAIGYNFGELPTAVSGFVYVDKDNDGVKDTDEVALAGTTVQLFDSTGTNLLATTLTDGNGFYQFTNLLPGTYIVRETQPLGFLDGTDTIGSQGGTTGSDQFTVTLIQGQQGIDNNFGELVASSLSGFVFFDHNNDALQQVGDTGIAGVTIRLTGTDDLSNPVTRTALTDSRGFYEFADLRPGTYQLTQTQPAGYLDGSDAIGTQGGTTGNDVLTNITLGANVQGTVNNFAEIAPARVDGAVYVDLNNNGVRDSGEAGIANTPITLTGSDDRGNTVTLLTTTAADGSFNFDNLRPGTYSLSETQPAAYFDGKDRIGDQGGTPANDQFNNFTLTTGQAGVNNLFGELPPASIAGVVFLDPNNNGIQTAGETGLAGVTVTLNGTDDQGNAVTQTTTTGADGSYRFDNLPPGTYTVTESQPAAYLDGIDTVGTVAGTVSNDRLSGIVLGAGVQSTANNFAEIPPASLAGSVYIDTDKDGARDGNETGLGGVTVTLTGTDDRGNPVSVSVTTDAFGYYLFENLRPGTYTISESQPIGYGDGLDAIGTQGGTPGNDTLTAIVLGAGVQGTANDFGEQVASLSGNVYIDLNNNGIRTTGEPPLGGVVVTLTGTTVRGQAVLYSTTTAPDGSYRFDNLVQGVYTLTETQPATWGDGLDTIGTINGSPVGNVGNDVMNRIALGAGQDGINYDFGERGATVAGLVWLDRDGDGVRDVGEPGLPGVVITLTGTDLDGNPVNLQVTTGTDGSYLFTNVPASNAAGYTITETQPVGYGNSPGTPAVVRSNVAVPPGANITDQNFGETLANLSGTVYLDRNNNGVYEPGAGETPISGVTVTLTGIDAAGTPVTRNATTDTTGAYRFDDLLAGTYTVTETQPTAYVDGLDTTGTVNGTPTGTAGNDVLTTIDVGAGQSGLNYNFGEQPPVTTPGKTFLTGTVFVDRGKDGNLDTVDPGLGGVTINLLDANGALVATTTSNPDGTYAFSNLTPGVYTIEQIQPGGYGSSTANVLNVTVPTTGLTNQNFGETVGSLAGTVYVDSNRNNALSSGEPRLAGVELTLTGTDVNGLTVTRTTTTDSNGNYLFDDLLGGSYVVTETQPAAYNDAAETIGSAGGVLTPPNAITSIPLGSGVDATSYNFGEVGTFVSGRVFLDPDQDGVLDNTENGIRSVRVELRDALGNVVATTLTDANGNYQFTDIPAGKYTLVEIQPTGYGDSPVGPFSPNSRPISVPLTGLTEQNYGDTLGSLAGTVFVDLNDDGSQQGGEPGIGAVLVTLTGTDVAGNPVTRTTTTDGSGNYRFDNLLAGTYVVSESQPLTYTDGKDAVGTSQGSLANDQVSNIVLGTGVNATGYTFGERLPSNPGTTFVAGTVYVDADRDGVLDGGERGLGGITIQLLDGSNNVVATTTTNPDGTYTFNNVAPGTYSIVEPAQPSGYGSSTPNTIGSVTVALVPVTNQNFGETVASLSGTVYVDLNNNGLYEPGLGETPLTGVTVTLTGSDVNGSITPRTTTTDANGNYVFTDLLTGTYTVSETQPSLYNDGLDTPGTVTGVPTGTAVAPDTLTGIALGAGTAGINFNFGERLIPAPTTFLAGRVYVDADRDGVRDSGETALAGVVLELLDENGSIVGTTTTNPDGSYQFTNLSPGKYTIQEQQPTGYASSTPNNLSVDVPLGGLTEQNFGETTASLSGAVYFDANNNGKRDGLETGIAGTTVTLTGTDDRGNPVTRTTTTDSNGNYLFEQLLSGTYSVLETQPQGYADGIDSPGSAGGVNTSNDTFTSVTLLPGQAATAYLFGERPPVTLPETTFVSGTVYIDRDRDGVLDGGETGLGGITLELRTRTGALVATTTTNPDGTYAFLNVIPGNYLIVEPTQPGGYGSSTPNTLTVTVPPRGLINQNFGETLGSVAGIVFLDPNNNGSYEPGLGETPLAGVQLTLTGTDVNGTLVQVITTTDLNGAYRFENLLAANANGYTVTETQPAGLESGINTAGSTGGTAALPPGNFIAQIPLAAGTDSTDNNFAELTPTGVPGTTFLSGTVFIDRNKDGVLNNGESGLGGVSLQLLDSSGNPVGIPITTNPDGSYAFTGLTPGTYTVAEFQPTGYGSSTPNTLTVVVPPTGLTNQNFGETRGSLAGTVYSDLNGNGLRNLGDPGIGNVSVSLYDVITNNLIATTTTHADGSYRFDDLLEGNYQLIETQPSGYLDGAESIGSAGGFRQPTDTITNIPLGAGVDAVRYNYGEVGASLSGRVYIDADRDGILQPGEAGLGGVLIELRDAGGNLIATTLTDAQGNYRFVGLAGGDYTVTEIQPRGYGSSTKNQLAVALPVAGSVEKLNFGETTSNVYGNVFLDSNINGLREKIPAESGFTGIPLTLFGNDVNGKPVLLTTFSDANGNYQFTGLLAGTYSIVQGLIPNGYQSTTPVLRSITLEGGVDLFDQDFGMISIPTTGPALDPTPFLLPGVIGQLSPLQLLNPVLGASFLTNTPIGVGSGTPTDVSYGYRMAQVGGTEEDDDSGILSGYVYHDQNNNHLYDQPDWGLGGVVVRLSGQTSKGLVVTRQTTTDEDGYYAFNNLPAGMYKVIEAQPTGFLQGEKHVGQVNGGQVGQAQENDEINTIRLPRGGTGQDYDFAELLPSSLEGVVKTRACKPGDMKASELGLEDIQVELTGVDDRGTTVWLVARTDKEGHYRFNQLRPGQYKVSIDNPKGHHAKESVVGDHGGKAESTVRVSQISLESGSIAAQYDFHKIKYARIVGAISETVPDVKAARTLPIVGGKVVLTGVDDTGKKVERTTRSGKDGSYEFNDLLPGTYAVEAYHTNGKALVAKKSGSLNGQASGSKVEPGTIQQQIELPAGGTAEEFDFQNR